LDAFRGSLKWLADGKFTDQDMHEVELLADSTIARSQTQQQQQQQQQQQHTPNQALLSVFASLDAPVAPSQRGRAHFSSGLTDQQRRAFRARVLALDRAALIESGRRLIGDVVARDEASIAVIGSQSRVDALRRAGGWLISDVQL
jgi:Zn-dependent M16 (insulinase) family peptidase